MSRNRSLMCALLACTTLFAVSAAFAQKAPTPDVPERLTIEGEFVRIAYNNEGWVTLGYRMAQTSIGEKYMLLETGITLQRGNKNQKLEG